MSGKVCRIIEYQEDRQRTPSEALEFLKDEVDKGNITHMLVIYRNDKFCRYTPASVDRQYKKSGMLWDMEHWRRHFLEEE
jgi:hypothetical protein